MDNRNNEHKMNMKIMWLMMLPCLLVPAAILLFSGKGFSIFSWNIILPIAVMVGLHFVFMKAFDGSCHSQNGKDASSDKKEQDNKA